MNSGALSFRCLMVRFIVLFVFVLVGMDGSACFAEYAGTLLNYAAPSQVALGAGLTVDTTVKNTGSSMWVAYSSSFNVRPSYYISFKKLSWQPNHIYQSAMMFHVYTGDMDSRTTTLAADNMPTAPGTYSVELECSYHTSYSGDNYTVMVNCPVIINFTIVQNPVFSVTASAGENGRVTPSGNVTVDQAASQTFTASADSDYTVDKWYLDGNQVQVGGTIFILSDVQAEHAVVVTFKRLSSLRTVFSKHDFDGDGRSDIAVYYQVTGDWYIKYSGGGSRVQNWGWSEAVPVPGDYDGDGQTDIAVYYQVTGDWYIQLSSGGTRIQNWGWSEAVPVPADYDGDGQTDIAVYHQATGDWYLIFSSGGSRTQNWGWSEAVPVPGDYDGDGQADLGIYDSTTGNWFILSLDSEVPIVFGQNWGWQDAVPAEGDYDNDGSFDIAVYYQVTGFWYIKLSGGGTRTVSWGWSETEPVPADYDGDGYTDLAVFYPGAGNWYISLSGGGYSTQNWGWSDTSPIQ